MEKDTYLSLIKNSKDEILTSRLSETSYIKKSEILKSLKKRRETIFISFKFYLILLIISSFASYFSYYELIETKREIFYISFSFFTFFCLPYLIYSLINEYIKIKKAYKKIGVEHKNMKIYLEMSIKSQEEEFYEALDQEKCSELAKIIYEHLALNMNLDASMSEKVAESVRKNLERFIFRDPDPKKVSKYASTH